MYKFTEGKINPDAFEQDKFWFDGKGVPHLISELPYSYARNILRKLYTLKGSYGVSSSPLVKAIRARMHEAKPS